MAGKALEEAAGLDASFAAYKERVRALYDRAAPVYGSAGVPFFQHAGRRLTELAGVAAGDRVLDVATGRGAVLFAAAERVGPAGSVLGIDLSSEMVRETGREDGSASRTAARRAIRAGAGRVSCSRSTRCPTR